MLQTYKATLRGNHLEWRGDAPRQTENTEIEVHVTILTESHLSSDRVAQGKKMAEALEKLASVNALADIADPSAWQREQRQDRQLPDREV